MGSYTNSSGVSVTLAEPWDGTSWTVQSTPNPAGATDILLAAVSCTSSAACTAVGSYTNSSGVSVTLAERWDGTSWTTQTLPFVSQGEAELSGVSCPAASVCTATGRIVQDYLTVPLSARSVFIPEMFVLTVGSV